MNWYIKELVRYGGVVCGLYRDIGNKRYYRMRNVCEGRVYKQIPTDRNTYKHTHILKGVSNNRQRNQAKKGTTEWIVTINFNKRTDAEDVYGTKNVVNVKYERKSFIFVL